MDPVTRIPRRISVSSAEDDVHFQERMGDILENLLQRGGGSNEPRPPAHSPGTVICRSCGKPEYQTRTDCRCGAHLKGQLLDEYWSFRANYCEEQGLSVRVIVWQQNFSFMLGCLLGLSTLQLPALLNESPFVPVEILFPLFWCTACICFAFSSHLGRKAKAIKRQTKALTFENYLSSLRCNGSNNEFSTITYRVDRRRTFRKTTDRGVCRDCQTNVIADRVSRWLTRRF